MVLPFLPERVLLPARLGVTAVAALVVVPLSLATSIGDRRIVAATWASVLFYVIWLALAGYGHNVGKFEDYVSLEGRGILFDQFSEYMTSFLLANNQLNAIQASSHLRLPPSGIYPCMRH
jgi:hypothetical protein